MKKMNYVIGLVVVLLFGVMPVSAKSELEMEEEILVSKLKMLNDYISFIGNVEKDMDARKYYIDRALSLFVNKGESYECNGTSTNGALIHITSLQPPRRVSKTVKAYLEGLTHKGYHALTINEASFAIIKMRELEKTEDGRYRAICNATSAFCGIRDGRSMYKDISRKKICLYFDKSQVDPEANETLVLLVDVYATER